VRDLSGVNVVLNVQRRSESTEPLLPVDREADAKVLHVCWMVLCLDPHELEGAVTPVLEHSFLQLFVGFCSLSPAFSSHATLQRA
jgi:hypothetical protein